jgi:hypothetical protein
VSELDLDRPRWVRLAAFSVRDDRFELSLRFLSPRNNVFTSSLDPSVPGE